MDKLDIDRNIQN